MKQFALIISLALLTSCAKSSSMPLAKNIMQIRSSATQSCGAGGAKRVAITRAAIETIKNGYERFAIHNSQYQSAGRIVGYTPPQAVTTSNARANTYGNTTNIRGRSTTTFLRGRPITAGIHHQDLIVKMFNLGEPGYETAISAKTFLGPKWRDAVSNPSDSCF